MDDHIIRIGTVCNGHWSMVIDLKELADSACIRKSRPGYSEKLVSVPLPRARKLLKLIWQYGRPEDFGKVDTYLEPNAKLHKYWRELCRI